MTSTLTVSRGWAPPTAVGATLCAPDGSPGPALGAPRVRRRELRAGPDYETPRAEAAAEREARRQNREAIRTACALDAASRSGLNPITGAVLDPAKAAAADAAAATSAARAQLPPRAATTTAPWDGGARAGRGSVSAAAAAAATAVAATRAAMLHSGLRPEARGRRTSAVLGWGRDDLPSAGATDAFTDSRYGTGGGGGGGGGAPPLPYWATTNDTGASSTRPYYGLRRTGDVGASDHDARWREDAALRRAAHATTRTLDRVTPDARAAPALHAATPDPARTLAAADAALRATRRAATVGAVTSSFNASSGGGGGAGAWAAASLPRGAGAGAAAAAAAAAAVRALPPVC